MKRNSSRFPEDFMFELSKEELANWRYQFGTSKSEKMGLRVTPFAFTEYGLLMLASVLKSERAIQINIQIVRIFSRVRTMIESHKEILSKLEILEKKDIELDEKVILIAWQGKGRGTFQPTLTNGKISSEFSLSRI